MEIKGSIDRDSRTPVYKQISSLLRTSIYALPSQDRKDSPIPTEKELCALFKTQRATLRKALEELLDEGLLYKIRGKGSFVAGGSLSAKRQRIEIVAAKGMAESASNPFSWFLCYDFIRGILAEAERLEAHCGLLDAAGGIAGVRELSGKFAPGSCLGVIFLGYRGYEELIGQLKSKGVPHVAVDGMKKDIDVNRVFTDREKGMSLAVKHLVALGHRRIALLNGPLTDSYFQERYNGYEQALRLSGIPVEAGLVAECGGHEREGQERTRDLLASHPDITGIVAATDLRAAGALLAAKECGRKVPEDLSITGYHDSQMARTQTPPLTTVRLPAYEMGEEAVRLLWELAAHPVQSPVGREIAASLVARGSTGKAPEAGAFKGESMKEAKTR